MALKKSWDAENDQIHYAGEHVVITGIIQGTVTLPDGSVVDVTAPVVEASSPEHAAHIAHAVSQRYADEGHPTDATFTYTPSKKRKG